MVLTEKQLVDACKKFARGEVSKKMLVDFYFNSLRQDETFAQLDDKRFRQIIRDELATAHHRSARFSHEKYADIAQKEWELTTRDFTQKWVRLDSTLFDIADEDMSAIQGLVKKVVGKLELLVENLDTSTSTPRDVAAMTNAFLRLLDTVWQLRTDHHRMLAERADFTPDDDDDDTD